MLILADYVYPVSTTYSICSSNMSSLMSVK